MSPWPRVSLGDICEFKYGRSLAAASRRPGVVPVYGSNGRVGDHDEPLTQGPTVIIGRKGSLGKVAFSEKPCWPIDTTYYVDATATAVDLRWLAYRLDGLGLTTLNRAAAIPGLNREDAYRKELLLPPLEEQRRIAAILDHADAVCSARRQAIAGLDSIDQSIYEAMFGTGGDHALHRMRLSDLCRDPEDIRCGPFGTQLSKSEVTDAGVPLWGIKNVNAFFRLPTREFLRPEAAERLRQYSLVPGDIVMTRKGTIGNCAVYPPGLPSGVMHSDLLRLRVDPARVLPEFLSHQLHHDRGVSRQVRMLSGGAVMPGINVTKLKELVVAVPPLKRQEQFVSRVRAAAGVRQLQSTQLRLFDGLLASLQDRAFKGEL